MPTKRKSRARAVSEVRSYSAPEMADFLVSNMPELNEAFTRADIELALDDRGWLTPGRGWTAADLDAPTRTTFVAKSRLYWMRDPLMKHAIRLWTDYSRGQGITWNSKDTTVKKKLDDFANDRRNKTIMNAEGQRRSSKKLLIDGELFFALFTEEDPVSIRRIDCLQITDIICDPEDEEHVLGYKRVTAQDKTLFYADSRCDEEDLQMLAEQKDPTGRQVIADKIEKDVKVYHLAWDTLLKRGNGLLFPALDWSKEHRRFMEARVAITQALAKYAQKIKVKGGQSIINAMTAKLQSTYSQTGATTVERHPQTAPAGTWIENAGVDMEPVKRFNITGGLEAMSDKRSLLHMICAATGIVEHYFGDAANANLATATAMELPMLKQFQSYQSFWTDAYYDLFELVCGEDLDPAGKLEIDMPPILLDDVRKIGQFVKFVADVFPEIRVPSVLRAMLNALNISNVDDVMEEVEDKQGELEQKNAALRDHQLKMAQATASGSLVTATDPAPANPKKPADPVPTNPEAGAKEADQLAALNRLAAALEEGSPRSQRNPVNESEEVAALKRLADILEKISE